MLEKIKEALKKYGIDEKHADKIKAATEADIDKAVFDYSLDLKVQSVIDQRVNQAIETHEKKRKEAEEQAKLDAENKNEKKPDQPSDIATIIQSALKPITDELNILKAANQKKSREELIKAELEKQKLDIGWADAITGEDADSIAKSVTAIKGRVDKVLQDSTNDILKNNGKPGNGNAPELGESAVKEMATQKNAAHSITGKPIGAAPLPGVTYGDNKT
jgi:membrane-associated HD superfamily phosphohydrolase